MNKAFEKIFERFDEKCISPKDYPGYVIDLEKANEIVQEVAEEYNGGWIPCNERLPEEMEDVLISVGSLKAVLGYYGHDKLWCFTDGMGSSKLIEQQELVIAWQPLPEPYKECKQI